MTDPRTAISDTVLATASTNVAEHPIVEAIEETSLSSTDAAIKNRYPLLDWDEYNEVEV